MKKHLLVCLLILLTSCRKTVTEYVALPAARMHWQADAGLLPEQKLITNAATDGRYLYLMVSQQTILALDSFGDRVGSAVLNRFDGPSATSTNGNYAFLPDYSDRFGYIYNLQSVVRSETRMLLSLSADSPGVYQNILFSLYQQTPLGAFAGNNFFYLSNRKPDGTLRLRAVQINDSAYSYVAAQHQRTFDIATDSFASWPIIQSSGDGALVLVNSAGTALSKLFKIDTLGNVSIVLSSPEALNSIFRFGSKLYLAGEKNVYVSENNGNNFTSLFSAIGGPGLYLFKFYSINNRLLAVNSDHIYEMVSGNSGFTVKELKNEGLAGNSITSVQLLGKRVYASTLSGLFSTEADSLFIPK